MNIIKVQQEQYIQKRTFGFQLTNLDVAVNKNKSLGSKIRGSNSLINKKQLKRQKSFVQNTSIMRMPSSTEMQIEEIKIPYLPKQPTQEYEAEIISYLIYLEKQKLPKSNYFFNQTEITECMRSILLNWLVQVHLKYKLMPQTLFITINIIDSYLQKQNIQKNQLQLLGITALWISAKFEQTYQIPKISNLQYICDNSYTKKEIFQMQGKILSKLEFNLIMTNSLTYLDIFNKTAKLEEKDYFLARYLIQMALLNYAMNKYKASQIATATIYLIKKIRKYANNQSLGLIYQHNESQIKKCARDLCNLLVNIDYNDHMQALKKKFNSKEYMQISRIKIGDKLNK